MGMNCIVIDDEPVAIDILADYIKKVPSLRFAGGFRSALKALKFLKGHEVDLIFLDINMPDLTGIQFLNSLEHHPLVIFTTAYSQYALESYDHDAVDYLLKPIEFERFVKAVNRAQSRQAIRGKRDASRTRSDKEDIKYALIKSGTEIHRVNTKDILYIKCAGNYVTFVTGKDEIMALMTLKEALAALPENRFYRVHKSYIVNFDRVDAIEKDQVRIRNFKIPIGDLYRQAFLDAIKKMP